MSSNVFAANVHYAGNVIMSQSLTVATLNVTTSTSTSAATFSATPAADANVLTVIGSSTTGNVVQFSNTAGGTFIMTSAGNVGIGKTNPGYAMDITGDLNFTGTFRQNGTPYVGSQWTGTSSIYFLGNVGIGTVSPATALDVYTGTMNAATVSSTTLYGTLAGSNTVAASTVSATSLVGTMYGVLAGSNTVAASTVTATSLVGTHYGVLAGSNTVAASTVSATSLVGTMYGALAGSNTVAASTVTATSLVGTMYGVLAGSNTVSASTVTATSLVGTHYGVLAGSNTVAASTVTATSVVGTMYGALAGSNTVAASTVSATSLVGTMYGVLAGSNTVSASASTFSATPAAAANVLTVIGSSTTGNVVQFSNTAGGTFIMTNAGRIGIGVTNPQVLLAAVGTCTLGNGAGTTTAAYHTGMVNIIGGGTRALLRIENNNSVGSPGIIFGEGGGFTEDTQPTIKKVQGTNNLAIMCGGNVGIGTTSPQSALHVSSIYSTFGVVQNENLTRVQHATLQTPSSAAVSAASTTYYGSSFSIYTGAITGYMWNFSGAPTHYGGDLTLSAGDVNDIGNNGTGPTNCYGGSVYIQGGKAFCGGPYAAYTYAAGDIVFQTGATALGNTSQTLTERMRVKGGTGNVGIGNATPPVKLWVPATSTTTGIGVYNNDVALIIGNLAGGTNTGSIQVKSGGSSSAIGATNYALALNPDGGNVGIGTHPGSYTLQVAGTIGASSSISSALNTNANGGYFIAQNLNAGSSAYTTMQWQTDTGSAYIFKNSSTRTGDGGVKTCTFRNDDGDLRLSAASSSPFIYLKSSNGNVGIGTTNPSVVLQVHGNGGNGAPLRLVNASASPSEVAIGFYRNSDSSATVAGDYWVAGINPYSVGDRNFGIGCAFTGLVLSILASGRVGINVTAPDSSLNINGTTSTNGVIQVVSNASGKNVDGMAFRAYSDTNYIIGFNNTANSLRGVIIGVNSGSVAYQTSSDRRLKTNIEDMPSAIERIKKLRPRKFTWTESGDKEEGFIAQEVHKVFPQFMSGFTGYCDYCQCSYNDLFDGKLCDCCDFENPMRKDGTPYIYGIDYGKFTPYLTKALQETLEIIETQSARITTLETENAQIKARLDSLESRLAAAGL